MSVNKHKPHLFVLPEDDANRQIANGFLLCPSLNGRAIQVLSSCGGWSKVLDFFTTEHVPAMRQYQERRIVLLIDLDDKDNRLSCVAGQIPGELKERVFILGVKSDPEELRKNIGETLENIGKTLAQECFDNANRVWGHDLLKDNKSELDRMILKIKPFLFINK